MNAGSSLSSERADAVVELLDVPRGLKNVVVTETGLGDVRGGEGFYHYRQYSAVELARQSAVEDVWHLLYEGHLPSPAQRAAFGAELATARRLPAEIADLLPAIGGIGDPLRGLRTALSAMRLEPLWDLDPAARRRDALRCAAVVPTVLTALHRLRNGQKPIEPRDDLSHAENYLYMLTGELPEQRAVRAIEQYVIAAIDHGFNASTFTARVIASTGADMAACLVGAIGALSGPLHGGAPSRALDTLDAIGTPDRIDPWITERVLAGDRIMGFGHPVYRTEDPRSVMLREIAQSFGGDRVDFAVQVEKRVLHLLAELKPGRELHTNVEFYGGVVMELAGLPRDMFTATFAVARTIGWTANILEQTTDTKIIRPSARYVGPPAPQPIPG
jgi:citrate synthase